MRKMNFKNNLTVRDITSIAVCIAVAIVLGKVLGLVHKVIPFSRSIVNAPFFSCLMALILYRVKKPGAMFLFGLGYGLTMIRISIFSTIAIVIGGILGELVTFFIAKNYDSDLKIALCAPLYSVGGIIGTFFTVTFLVDSPLYAFEGKLALFISMITVYIAGLIGSFFAIKVLSKRVFRHGKKAGSGV